MTTPKLAAGSVFPAIDLPVLSGGTRSLATPALQGVAILVGFWFLDGIAGMVSSRGLAYGEWAPWGVVAFFLAAGLYRLRRIPT